MKKHELDQLFDRYRRQDDGRALSRVFDLTAPMLLRIARHVVRDADEAEDLVQSTFLTAVERRETYEGGGRLSGWLAAILVNHARNLRRRGRPGAAGEVAVSDDPHDSVTRVESSRAVAAAVGTLPEGYRELLALRYESELSTPEIAALLERPPGTVRSQLSRAVELLRRLLPAGLVAWLVMLRGGRRLASLKQGVMQSAGVSPPAAGSAFAIATGMIVLASTAAAVGIGFGVGNDPVRLPVEEVADGETGMSAPLVRRMIAEAEELETVPVEAALSEERPWRVALSPRVSAPRSPRVTEVVVATHADANPSWIASGLARAPHEGWEVVATERTEPAAAFVVDFGDARDRLAWVFREASRWGAPVAVTPQPAALARGIKNKARWTDASGIDIRGPRDAEIEAASMWLFGREGWERVELEVTPRTARLAESVPLPCRVELSWADGTTSEHLFHLHQRGHAKLRPEKEGREHEGVVVDRLSGIPVAGAPVEVHRLQGSRGQHVRRLRADAAGAVRLPRGGHVLVLAPGYLPYYGPSRPRLELTPAPTPLKVRVQGKAPDRELLVELRSGATPILRGVTVKGNLHLHHVSPRRSPRILGDLHWTSVDARGVRGGLSAPTRIDAIVAMTDVAWPPCVSRRLTLTSEVGETAPDGTRVTVTAGTVRGTTELHRTAERIDARTWQLPPLQAEVADLRISRPAALSRGHRVSLAGDVEVALQPLEVLTGRCVDEAGEPVVGMRFQATAQDWQETGTWAASALSGPDGTFEFRLPRGRKVDVGFARWKRGFHAKRDMVRGLTTASEGLEFVVVPIVTIPVEITSPDAHALRHAMIIADDVELDPAGHPNTSGLRAHWNGPRGRVELPAGRPKVTVVAHGHHPLSTSIDTASPAPLRLRTGPRLSGRLATTAPWRRGMLTLELLEVHGAALPPAWIRALNPFVSIRVGADGAFASEALIPGRYKVQGLESDPRKPREINISRDVDLGVVRIAPPPGR